MSELVNVVKGIPLVSTMELAKGFGVEHASILIMVEKYDEKFQQIRAFKSEIAKSGGRPTKFYNLDEEQTTFLVSLMRNSDMVVQFKYHLVREFYKAKRLLADLASQHQNTQWLETRNSGKIKRLEETDNIKTFVEYAKAQGSQNAERYYINITTMENKALFFIEQKFPNLREVLNVNQLSIITCADNIVSKALKDGMISNLNYKDIYSLAKHRVEQFAEIHGKTLIPVKFQQIELLVA
jgi:phage regulator Rha-like protein